MLPQQVRRAPQETVRSILLDDSACDRRQVARLFDRLDLPLETAREAAEFFGMIAAAEYDLALVDHRLGADSGLDILEVLATEGPPRMTRVLLTGMDDPRLAARAHLLGFRCVRKGELSIGMLSDLIATAASPVEGVAG